MALNLNLASGYHLPEISSALKSYVAATGKPDTLGLTPSDTSAPPDTGPPPPDNAPPPGAPLINALPEEAQPIPIAPVDPNAAPTPGAVPTESSGDRAARASKESFYDFENNPVGSLGRAMAQFAAGYRGDPNSGPLAQFDKQKLEERAMQYKQVEFGMNFLDKAIPLIEAAPDDQKEAVAQHLQESVGGTIGHDFTPMLTAIAKGEIKNAAESMKAISTYVTDPKLAALITANPKLVNAFSEAILKEKAKAIAEPDKTYNVPSGGVVIGAKGNVIFDNRKGDTEKTYTLGPGEIVKNANNETIATGPAAKPDKPDRTEFSAPTAIEYDDGKGGKTQATLQQNRDSGQWVTADAKRTPVDVGTNFRVVTGAASNIPGGGRAAGQVARVMGAANLAIKEIRNVSSLQAGATTGYLADYGIGGTPFGALARKMTGQQAQSMQASGIGLGRSLAALETMGLVPPGQLTKNFEGLIPHEGDTGFTVLQKLGHMRQSVEAALQSSLDSPLLSSEQKNTAQESLKEIAKVIPWLPEDVFNLLNKGKRNQTIMDFAASKGLAPKAAAAPAKSSVMDQADAILRGGP